MIGAKFRKEAPLSPKDPHDAAYKLI